MYILLLAATLFLGLSVARRAVEPACPCCAAKRWTDYPPQLTCRECGWTNLAPVVSDPLAREPRDVGLAAEA